MSVAAHIASKALVVQPELADAKFDNSCDRAKFSYSVSEGTLRIRTGPDLDKNGTHYTLRFIKLLWRVRKLAVSAILALPEGVEYT